MATTTTEIERKYSVPDGFGLPELTGVAGIDRVDGPEEFQLDATYYDTDDLRLASHRMTLRRRVGGGDEGWHLKEPAGNDRTETREPLTSGTDVPPSLAKRVRGATGGADLIPVARISTVRRETSVRDARGAVLAVIADDAVTGIDLGDPGRASRWRELEVELVDGPRELLDEIEAKLAGVGVIAAASPSKFARTLGDRFPTCAPDGHDSDGHGSDGHGGHGSGRHGSGGKSDIAGTVIADYLRSQRDAIAANDPLVRSGDADGVHDMRVALRRVRATLRTFRPILERDTVEPLRDELHWLARLLGGVRDGDVLERRLARRIDELADEQVVGPVRARIRQRLAAEVARARDELTAALDSNRYAAMLREFDAMCDADPPIATAPIATAPITTAPIAAAPIAAAPIAAAPWLRHRARKALRRADARLEHALAIQRSGAAGVDEPSGTPADPDVAFHEARKAYKRGRYAVEVVTPLTGHDGKRLAKRIGELQDVLGDHQDSVVAARLLRDFGMRAHLDGDNAFTYGLLYARETTAGERDLDALTRTHKRAGKPKVRRCLD